MAAGVALRFLLATGTSATVACSGTSRAASITAGEQREQERAAPAGVPPSAERLAAGGHGNWSVPLPANAGPETSLSPCRRARCLGHDGRSTVELEQALRHERATAAPGRRVVSVRRRCHCATL